MSRSPWGRPRNNELVHDLQVLAFWLVLILIGGYLLFPNFFQDLYSRLQLPVETPAQTTEPDTATDTSNLATLPPVFQQVYGGSQAQELSQGYWVVFVQDGQFQQLALSEESYNFLLGVITKDQAGGNQKLILAANGQVKQLSVSEEVFGIVNQLNIIGGRTRSP